MSVIDVTPNQDKPTFSERFRKVWDLGMNRFFWDHIKRGLQIGSVFGTVIVLPMTIFNDMKKLKVFSLKRVLMKQAASLSIGIGLSLAWMSIRYLSWSNKQQKLHDETYYLPGQIQNQFDYITTFWGGGAFLLTFLITKRLVLSFGVMSPVIAFGMAQSQIRRFSGN